MRGRLTFIGEIGCEDHFLDHAVRRSCKQSIEADVAGSNAIERRKASRLADRHKVQASSSAKLLHRTQ